MKKLSFLLVALALFCFISLNSCKQKAGEAEEATEEEVVEEAEEMVEEPMEADTVAEEAEAEEETME
jgi:large-conductance mechanosensitive channel